MVENRCKYLLPCGVCDKYDKRCDVVETEVELCEAQLKQGCKHDWKVDKVITFPPGKTSNAYRHIRRVCRKCGSFDFREEELK